MNHLPARWLIPDYDEITGRGTFVLLSEYREPLARLYASVPKGAVWAGTWGRWYPRRSTGPKSQNNHEWGHEQTIASALGYDDVRAIHEVVGWKATGRGLPLIYIGKIPIPKPAHLCNTTEQALRIEAAHQLAAEEGIKLVEENE